MPPQFATLLCLIFILFLFVNEKKANPYTSYALWIPFIWLFIIGSRSIAQWLTLFTGGSYDALSLIYEGNPIDRFIYALLEFIGILILFKRREIVSEILKKNKWLIIFLLYCATSLLWSDYTFIGFKRWIKTCGNFIMVMIIITETSPVEAIKTIFRRLTFMLMPLSILFIKYYGDFGRVYSPVDGHIYFTGVAQGKNSLGNLCIICGIFLIWNLANVWFNKVAKNGKYETSTNLILLIMILWLFYKADSLTSLICFVIGAIVLSITSIDIMWKNLSKIGIITAGMAIFAVFIGTMFELLPVILESLGRQETFSGRTVLWGELLDMVNNPLLGTGYQSFWQGERLEALWEQYWWMPRQAHNGYLEVYINLGVVGLSLLLIYLVSSYRKCFSSINNGGSYVSLRPALFIIVILYNITEASFAGMSIIWFILILISCEIPKISSAE